MIGARRLRKDARPLGVISVRAERRSCRCGGVRRQCLRAKRCVKLKPTLRGSAESKAAGKTQLAADNTLGMPSKRPGFT